MRKNDFFEFPRDLGKSGQLLKVFKIALYGILKINYLEMVIFNANTVQLAVNVVSYSY